jgi:hypothetical protein
VPAPVPISASPPASAAPPAPPAPPPDPGPTAVPIDATFRASLRAVVSDKPSLGHAGGRWNATTYANDAGERAWKADARDDAEPGALLVAEHVGASEKGPVLVMQKRGPGYDDAHRDWYYAVLAPDLRPMREGKLADCAACHGLAKRDHVFGE